MQEEYWGLLYRSQKTKAVAVSRPAVSRFREEAAGSACPENLRRSNAFVAGAAASGPAQKQQKTPRKRGLSSCWFVRHRNRGARLDRASLGKRRGEGGGGQPGCPAEHLQKLAGLMINALSAANELLIP